MTHPPSSLLVRLERITKSFDGIVANDSISLDIHAGQIHGILGENGAGKTTLMNILFGLYRSDHGSIFVRGRPTVIRSPRDAIAQGIGMIHQHFMLVPRLTVTQNILLGARAATGPMLDLRSAAARVQSLSASYGLAVDPFEIVGTLSVGGQQRVEILKNLYRGVELLILDEPTSVLTPIETRELMEVMRRLAGEGRSIIFISHKLDEILQISHWVTVLRRGRVVGSLPAAGTSKAELATLMVGHEVSFAYVKERGVAGDVVLSVEDLHVNDARGLPAVRGVSFTIREGEILGLAGVDGNGQDQLVEAICGLRRPRQGAVRLGGVDCTTMDKRLLIDAGLAHVPSDSRRHGLLLEASIAENAILTSFDKPPLSRFGFLRWPTILAHVRDLITRFLIHPPRPRVTVRTLSGGNQQKVVLARELSRHPKLLVAHHPTKGLDVAATESVHQLLLDQRQQGAAVLLVSTELEELLAICDRVAVMFRGRLTGIVDPQAADPEQIGLIMAGATA